MESCAQTAERMLGLSSNKFRKISWAQRWIRTTDTRLPNPNINKSIQKLKDYHSVKPLKSDQIVTQKVSNFLPSESSQRSHEKSVDGTAIPLKGPFENAIAKKSYRITQLTSTGEVHLPIGGAV